MYRRLLATTLSAVAMTTASCTTEVPGRAALPEYHGPDIAVLSDSTTEILSPGTPVTVGSGALSATCTAGWVVRTTSDHRFGMLTAGHCLRSLRGSVVALNYRDEHQNSTLPDNTALPVGTTESTTYPGEGVDVGLFLFDYTEENSRVPVAPVPEGVPVVTDISGRSVRPSVGANVGDLVCWYTTGATTTMRGAVRESCGTVDSTEPLVSVSLDQGASVRPQDSGAPAVVKKGSRNIPLGVLSYEQGGKARVSVVGSAVAGTGIEFMTGMP